jgi:hypothetical protein
MKGLLCLTIIHLLVFSAVPGQSLPASSGAVNPPQVSQPDPQQSGTREFKIPAGTPLEIETAYTVDSQHVRSEDLISFRVLVPIKSDGVTLIEKYSLVTGRVVEAKRGRHWGRAGRLSWIMQDVVAVDLTRVPLQASNDATDSKNAIKGTSHAGQVATEMIVLGSVMFWFAPIVLMHGFKRGENAVLPEGKRFIVFVKQDTVVKVPVERATSSSSVVGP